MNASSPPPGRALLLLELVLGLALLVWPAVVLRRHALPGGVTIELIVAGGLLLPLHLRRGLALAGLAPPPAWPALLPELGALLALGLEQESLALGLGLLANLPLLLARGEDAPAAGRLGALLPALSALALLAGLGSLVLAAAWGRALAWPRLALLLPLLLEASAPARPRGPRAATRRASAGVVAAVLGACRFEALFALLGALAGAAGALMAWRAARRGPEERARAWRRDALRLAACAATLLLLLLAGEVGIRLVPNDYGCLVPPDADQGRPAPGAVTRYVGGPLRPAAPRPVEVRWNSLVMHDLDHALARPPGVVRLVVLGDSYVEGKQVELEELFHRRLEAALRARTGRAVEVIALGRSGWGQVEALAALREQGLAFDPDLALFQLLPMNDVRDNLPALRALSEAEQTASSFARPLFADAVRKRLASLAWAMDGLDRVLRRGVHGTSASLDEEVYREAPAREPELWAQAWARTGELLQAAQELMRARGAAAAGFMVPSIGNEVREAADPSGPRRHPFRKLAALCAAAELPALDLGPRFARAAPDPDALYLQYDGHWSPAGHALAAEEVARWLVDESGLWGAAAARAEEVSPSR